MIDKYIYVIVALLPITSIILVFQCNPYQALVVRAILGAVAALVYATLGGADVALTEALVGTMLAITLYIVAVRSSLVMRLGVVNLEKIKQESYFEEFLANLKQTISQYHLRLEIVDYSSSQALQEALMTKDVHAICTQQDLSQQNNIQEGNSEPILNTAVRIHRLFEILQPKSTLSQTTWEYITVASSEDKH